MSVSKKRIKDLEIDKKIEEDVEIEAKPKFDEPIRLNKYLAHAGVASRRKADEYIAQGKVKSKWGSRARNGS
jgi:RNA-binding protein YlmH